MKDAPEHKETEILLRTAVVFGHRLSVCDLSRAADAGGNSGSKNGFSIEASLQTAISWLHQKANIDADEIQIKATEATLTAAAAHVEWLQQRLRHTGVERLWELLTQNVHLERIWLELRDEPLPMQQAVLAQLPENAAAIIGAALNIEPHFQLKSAKPAALIARAVQNTLLARLNFAAEDHVAAVLNFNVEDTKIFVEHLGLREIAIACDALPSSEAASKFLQRFARSDVKKIAGYLRRLRISDELRLKWAEILVVVELERGGTNDSLKKRLGLRILSFALAPLAPRQLNRFKLKLSPSDADFVQQHLEARSNSDAETNEMREHFAVEVNVIAENFKQLFEPAAADADGGAAVEKL